MNLKSYAPFLITNIANRWTAAASRRYLRDFVVGVTEGRELAALAEYGQATSLEIVNLISMDAAAVSRAMRTLSERGFVSAVSGRFKGRNKPFAMTEAGVALYLRIYAEAAERENFLLRALDEEERTTLLALLGKVHEGLPEL